MPTLQCPICQRRIRYDLLQEVPYRPFCGNRCKLIDLGKWLNEEYRISEEIPDEHRRPPEDDGKREGDR